MFRADRDVRARMSPLIVTQWQDDLSKILDINFQPTTEGNAVDGVLQLTTPSSEPLENLYATIVADHESKTAMQADR